MRYSYIELTQGQLGVPRQSRLSGDQACPERWVQGVQAQLDEDRVKLIALENSDGIGEPSSVSRGMRLSQDGASLSEVSRLAWDRAKVTTKQIQEATIDIVVYVDGILLLKGIIYTDFIKNNGP